MNTPRSNIALALFLALTLSACAPAAPPAATLKDPGSTHLDYFDSSSFDRNLSAVLAARPAEATVTFPAVITLNNIPPRFEKWLSAVDQSGGKVRLQAEPEEDRNFLSEALSLFVRAYTYIQEVLIYAPARAYDATVYYRRKEGVVTRVVFGLRP